MRQLVCLAAEPWSSVPKRTQQLMSRMKDTEVLFFEPSTPHSKRDTKGRRVRPGVIVYTLPPEPSVDPSRRFLYRLSRSRSTRFLQDTLDRHRFKEPVLWCATPTGAVHLDDLAYRGLVYDCCRDWPECPEPWESDLTTAADVVFAASPDLAAHLSPCNPNVALLPNGCSYPMFAKDGLPRPQLLRNIDGPILGFVGTLWPDLDLTPLIRLAAARPDCNLVLVGRDMGCRLLPQLLEEPNVFFLGPAESVDLPEYLSAFQVCLYPLRHSELDSDVIHSRLFEYLASGKPVVAMLRPDQVEHFPDVVYGAHSPSEFVLLASRALEERGDWAKNRRREYGKAASWSRRAEEVCRILESIGLFT